MARKLKKYRVGMDSETYAISLVEMPAIEEELVALAKQEQVKVQLADDTKHMVFSAVLIPDKPIYRCDDEGNEYYLEFSKESIEKMSQEFFKNYRQNEITLDHEDMASDITVVESWLKSDLYKDKSVALGLNPDLPIGTWFAGMKINQIDVWDRVKNGQLRGFSVESLVSLEEFSKIDNNMEIKTDEMNFWNKMKEVLAEAFSKKEEEPVAESTEIEAANIDLEAEPEPAPEPVSEPSEPVSEPQAEADPDAPKGTQDATHPQPAPEPAVEPQNEPEPVVEEPKADNSHLEELIGNLKAEIEALKEMNNGLKDKISEMGKQPSAAPINTNAKPSCGDTYASWRDTMRSML